MFVFGNVYRRSDLHKLYGGQKQGGISTPSDERLIMLFTGETGHQYGYQDKMSCLTIEDLCRWQSLDTLQRYTRSVNFQESLRYYKSPLLKHLIVF